MQQRIGPGNDNIEKANKKSKNTQWEKNRADLAWQEKFEAEMKIEILRKNFHLHAETFLREKGMMTDKTSRSET